MYKVIISIVLMMLSNHSFSKADDYVLQEGQSVEGKELAEYSNIWWQWAYSMSDSESAVRDINGSKCHVNQTGDVWFLAGGYGRSKISRKCTIPAGNNIFFPVINMVYYPRNSNLPTCESVKISAALNNDKLLKIDVELNGSKISNPRSLRLKSPKCFDLLGMVPRYYNPRKVYPSASDGYWVMLKPLEKGIHTLKFNAKYQRPGKPFGDTAQDIEYILEVR